MSDWFKTGEQAHEKMEKDEEQRIANQDRVFRHWMPEGAEMYATFLDDQKHPAGYDSPFVFEEHNLKLNNNYRNWFTCIEGLPHPETGKPQKCPICALGTKESRPYLASAFTIIDHSRWESKKKKGQIHEHELKLFVCKSAVQKTLRKNAKKREGLRGWYVEVTRSEAPSANTGDQFDFEKRLDDKALEILTGGKYKELPQPLNYHDIFAPKSQEELEKILSGEGGGGGYSTNDNAGDSSGANVDAQDDFVKF